MKIIKKLAACLVTMISLSMTQAWADNLPCQPLKGIDAVWTRAPGAVIWVGEMHGTNEMPALFGDMVCAAGADGQPVVVVLERSAIEEPFWHMFLASDGGDEARGWLLMGVEWRSPSQDGRSSAAILGLADRMRVLKAGGRRVSIDFIHRAFDPAKPADAQMAQTVMAVRAQHPEARILVYTGNFHAMKKT